MQPDAAPDAIPAHGFSPDASLSGDESFVATSHRGLVYPMGSHAPEAVGAIVSIRSGVGWARMPLGGSLAHINIWLLDDNDALTVVDTGINNQPCVDEWRALIAGPLAERRVGRVIGTHFHPDHIGLAGWLCRKFGASLWMTRGEWLTARMLIADARPEVPQEQLDLWRAAGWSDAQVDIASGNGFGRMARAFAPLPLGYRRIVDGEIIPIGGGVWRVVVGSGHSPEHACLWNEVEGLLIAGDQVLPRISSNVSLSVTEPQADPLGEWLESIDKLLRLPADLLVLPSHGEPFTGLHVRLIALRDEHLKRLAILEQHLSEPRRAVDCFGRMFRRAIGDDVLGLATGETLAHLRRLEVEGRAVREERGGAWWFRATG